MSICGQYKYIAICGQYEYIANNVVGAVITIMV